MATQPVYIYGETPNTILNIARSRVNSMVLTPSGFPGGSDPGSQFNEVGGGDSLSTELNPDGSIIFKTQIIFNAAYRKFQKYLANLGYRLLIGDNLVIEELPPNTNTDPSSQSWLSWNGFWNGTVFTATPALPEDFYAPLKIRERINGQDTVFIPMRCALDGLRNIQVRGIYNGQWEWRTNALYLTGATSTTDLQFRYIRYLPNLPDPNYYLPGTVWYEQKLPIVGCASALAWYIAYEALCPNPDAPGAADVLAQAQGEADLVFNDQARADQRTNCRRRPRGGAGSSRRGYSL